MTETYWHREFGEIFADVVVDKTPEVEANIGFWRNGMASMTSMYKGTTRQKETKQKTTCNSLGKTPLLAL